MVALRNNLGTLSQENGHTIIIVHVQRKMWLTVFKG